MERTITVEKIDHLISVFGSFDENIRIIERELDVRLLYRDTEIKITGEEEQVAQAVHVVEGLLSLAARREPISSQTVLYAISLAREGNNARLEDISRDVICVSARGKPVKAKTVGQKRMIDAIRKNTVTICVGPAGTGKTYLAVAAAVTAFREKQVNRIIITRPAVEAGERLGFLPGDLQSKVDPYLRPLYDALFDLMGPETYHNCVERGNIEVAPLAYMRGRTLDESFIILDEAQNTTPEQMKMFLTRIGFGSKAVVNGDETQVDLPIGKASGLKSALKILDNVEDIAICRLTERDVVRHELVQRIIRAYEEYEKKNQKKETAEKRFTGRPPRNNT